MDKNSAVSHFGSQMALAKALGLGQSTVAGWKTIPGIHQLRIEELTQGALRADAGTPRGYVSTATAA